MVLGETVLGGVGCTGWNSNGSRPYVGGGKQVSLSRGGERGRGMNRAPPPHSSLVYKGFLNHPSLYQQLCKPDQPSRSSQWLPGTGEEIPSTSWPPSCLWVPAPPPPNTLCPLSSLILNTPATKAFCSLSKCPQTLETYPGRAQSWILTNPWISLRPARAEVGERAEGRDNSCQRARPGARQTRVWCTEGWV